MTAFTKLVQHLKKTSGERLKGLSSSEINEIFNSIDVGKDGLLDRKEWAAVFSQQGVRGGRVTLGVSSSVPAKLDSAMIDSQISNCIGKNRSSLVKHFKEIG